MSKNKKLKLQNSRDIRNLYNELLLDDIVKENPKNKPDGKIFRRDSVSVNNNGKEVHIGILPESRVIKFMDLALDYLNNDEDDLIIRIGIFHYLFGYIHPFYDGNGRLSRYISCWAFTEELEPIIAYCFSLAVKNNLKKYYKVYNICNHVLNKGDLTPFLDFFVALIADTYKDLNYKLKEKKAVYDNYKAKLMKLSQSKDDKYFQIYDLLLQATLFSELGISTTDLLNLTNTSRTTLRSRIAKLSKDILAIKKIGNTRFYSFKDLSLLD